MGLRITGRHSGLIVKNTRHTTDTNSFIWRGSVPEKLKATKWNSLTSTTKFTSVHCSYGTEKCKYLQHIKKFNFTEICPLCVLREGLKGNKSRQISLKATCKMVLRHHYLFLSASQVHIPVIPLVVFLNCFSRNTIFKVSSTIYVVHLAPSLTD